MAEIIAQRSFRRDPEFEHCAKYPETFIICLYNITKLFELLKYLTHCLNLKFKLSDEEGVVFLLTAFLELRDNLSFGGAVREVRGLDIPVSGHQTFIY